MDGAEVVIVGAGVTGLSTAWWLAKSGVDVVVVDKGVVGYEASSRNGGDTVNRANEPPVYPLAAESLRIWPVLADEIGYPTEFYAGSVHVSVDEEAFEMQKKTRHRMEEKFGIESKILDAQEIRELLPMVGDNAVGGSISPSSGHANPQRSVQAYAWGAQDHGARIYQHTRVTGFTVEGGKATAVETERGTIEADVVVCAAGPQTAILAEMVGAYIPVAPGRVEIIITAPVERMFDGAVSGIDALQIGLAAVSGNGLYGRQTARGNLAYGGGPHEWIDVENETPIKPNTPLVRNLAARLVGLFANAKDVPIIRSWAGVVEQTPDYLPIFDFLDSPENFLVATASAHGFGLSPATGKVISELVMHGETTVDISGLKLGRFGDVKPGWREERNWVPGYLNT